ncbi:ROCK2-like protein [Mya arenaria]|uniref:ROCK2-like protein n=1 Tax=Mya arenaria TaxID=6604 RepID=A0ABY7F534_MYAAR|nr:ROCK2-like protein [Mya arenaria]
MASAPASAQNPRRAPAVAPKPSRITMKRYDDHELKQKPTLLQGSDVSSITEVTGSRRPPPVATKLSRISIKQNYNHELKQEPSLLQSSNVYEESLQFTCKYSEEIMSRSNTVENNFDCSAVSLDIEERQQIEKQRQNQLAAEKFSHEEITKLEDELEEHKRIQTTVGEFAKINSDKLKVHLQEQISRRRFAEKYANEEIVKLDVLANLIALQEKRVKGLETNNARYEQGDPPELLNDNGSQTDVVKQLKEEEMKKMQAMKKPAKGRVFSDKERQQFQEILLNESYFEAGFNACIQKAEEREIKEPIEWSMNKMGGYLNVSRFGWNKLFVVVSRRHVIFFKSLGEKQTAEPVLKLDIGWIQDARHYRETDDHELKDLPRIFVLLYDVAGERLYDQLNTEKKGSKYHADKGCNTKRLTLHFDNFDDNVRPGHRIPIGATAKPADGSNLRRLFLQAESHDMKEDWITHIKEKVRQFLESSSGHKTEYFGGKVI